MITPIGDEGDQHRADGVDLRRHAQADRAVDPHRQGGGAGAGGEAGDDQVVEREGEGQQPAADQGRGDDRQGDDEEGLERRGAQIHGRLLEAAVEGDQARLDDHGDVAHGEGRVRDDDGPEAARRRPWLTNSSSSDRPRITSGMTSGAEIMPAKKVRPGKRAIRVSTTPAMVPRISARVEDSAATRSVTQAESSSCWLSSIDAVPLQREAAPDGDQLRGVERDRSPAARSADRGRRSPGSGRSR